MNVDPLCGEEYVARRLLNLMAFVSLAICVATLTARLTTAWNSQSGITFGAPGGRFVVLKADGAGGDLRVYRDWPMREPLRAFWGERYIGPSGQAGPMSMWWTNQRFGLSCEWGNSYVYVAPDGRTPLMGWAAVNSHNPSASLTPFWLLFFPLNLLVAVTAALPVVAGVAALVRYARRASVRRAHAASRCVRCGYDLRATPARCPECGAVPAEGPQTAA